jgi:hypothetical protein
MTIKRNLNPKKLNLSAIQNNSPNLYKFSGNITPKIHYL